MSKAKPAPKPVKAEKADREAQERTHRVLLRLLEKPPESHEAMKRRRPKRRRY